MISVRLPNKQVIIIFKVSKISSIFSINRNPIFIQVIISSVNVNCEVRVGNFIIGESP